MSDRTIIDVKIADIIIGERFRKRFRNIEDLAESITEIGLQNPIIITPQYKLVSGGRRIQAFKLLGREEIPARIESIERMIDAEVDENNQREAFTVTERLAIAEALTEEIGERRGRPSQDTDNSKDKNVLELEQFKKTADYVAKKSGFGCKASYYHAKEVLEKAIPEVVEAMDSDIISVNRAHIISQAKKGKQLTLLNEAAKHDPDVDSSLLADHSTTRRKAKRAQKNKVPKTYTSKAIYNVIRVAPDWENELMSDLKELPVDEYIVPVGVVLIEVPNRHLDKAFSLIAHWGFHYAATITAYNAKAVPVDHLNYINSEPIHIVIGQMDVSIPMTCIKTCPVHNRQNLKNTCIDVSTNLWAEQDQVMLDMSATEPAEGWDIWKLKFADKPIDD